jgi:REP element-mobilizing transposase RayT
MTRLRRIADHDRIFFITVRLGRGITPLSPGERDIVQEYVAAERAAYKFLLFGYVVMPDHLHILMAPFRAGLQAGMHCLKMRTDAVLGKHAVKADLCGNLDISILFCVAWEISGTSFGTFTKIRFTRSSWPRRKNGHGQARHTTHGRPQTA